MNAENNQDHRSDASVAELVRTLSEQSSRLASQEVELAKAELTAKGKRIGAGVGAFGAAGVVALYAGGALVATLILLLSEAMDAWLAAAIVTAGLAVVGGVLALGGKKSVEAGTPPTPERAIESSRQDLETAKQRAREGRA